MGTECESELIVFSFTDTRHYYCAAALLHVLCVLLLLVWYRGGGWMGDEFGGESLPRQKRDEEGEKERVGSM